MKANELRIGNYVYDVNEKVSRVEEISMADVSRYATLSSQCGFFYRSEILPIPLTEEWFLKFSFFNNDWFGYEHIKHRDFEIYNENEGVYRLSVNSNEYVIGKPIEFVHQLQNLCFALTGEELEIKPE